MKPSRTLLTLDEAADALGITLLDLLDYAKQGLLEVVINSDRLRVNIMATSISQPLPMLQRKGFMMNPEIFTEDPAGEIVLYGGHRAVDEATLKSVFEEAAAGQESLGIHISPGFKPTDKDNEIMAKFLGCKQQDVWLDISQDCEHIDETGIEKPLTFYVTNDELERFKEETFFHKNAQPVQEDIPSNQPVEHHQQQLKVFKIATEKSLEELEDFFRMMAEQEWVAPEAKNWVGLRFTNSLLKEKVPLGTPMFDWLDAGAKLRELGKTLSWPVEQIQDHFQLKGNPVKISSLKSGGNITDDSHKKAVQLLVDKKWT